MATDLAVWTAGTLEHYFAAVHLDGDQRDAVTNALAQIADRHNQEMAGYNQRAASALQGVTEHVDKMDAALKHAPSAAHPAPPPPAPPKGAPPPRTPPPPPKRKA